MIGWARGFLNADRKKALKENWAEIISMKRPGNPEGRRPKLKEASQPLQIASIVGRATREAMAKAREEIVRLREENAALRKKIGEYLSGARLLDASYTEENARLRTACEVYEKALGDIEDFANVIDPRFHARRTAKQALARGRALKDGA